MILSVHARERMLKKGISEEEVRECINFGIPQAAKSVEGEVRHAKLLDLKGKSVVVIYTFREDELRVITAYAIIKNDR